MKSKTAQAPGASQPADSVPEKDFPIVGIGASAGGLAAFEAFFSGMPADVDPGMAFILVQHLAPDHKSILTELIRKYTRMQVFEVEDGMRVHINCAYVIPPNRDMAFLNGVLQLMEPGLPHGKRLPIDFFFRSLAQDLHSRAICIVLSGTGHDGTQGVREVKAEGGMAMAQNPQSTEYDGMPRSAIDTGLIDFQLPPAEMPAQLISYASHAFGSHKRTLALHEPNVENAQKKIFILLRAQTGHDFSKYKPNTILRRIDRRMAVHQISTIAEYVKYLQQTPAEIDLLYRDLLIGVTSFFRDPQAFADLESKVIPLLFANKSPGSTIRIWTTGCSTGEEAYSIAILIAEYIKKQTANFHIQVFATDIDAQAVATARAGLYSVNIIGDMSAERLGEFFVPESDSASSEPTAYRIKKKLRDMLVFSEQDLIRDPPFSKLDLISCRNLLIYMGSELQKKIIPLFHYALNPGGILFLGTSETTGNFIDLFDVLDRKSKLYQRKEDFNRQKSSLHALLMPSPIAIDALPPQVAASTEPAKKISLREITERALLRQLEPAGALVGVTGEIFYVYGRTGAYLEPASGEACVGNVLKMARDGLRHALTISLQRAASTMEVIQVKNIRIKTVGHITDVDFVVRPLAQEPAQPPLFLVIFSESSEKMAQQKHVVAPLKGEDSDSRILSLKQELRTKDEYLQAANEELETSNEELKSSNEEMQSVNEELQSTNEELETSKEELQSINEELSTVNTELQTKVADLSRSNNDMNNLMAGTGIGTVFVNHELRIQRFTPAATRIINLIMSDIGRPVGHLVSNLTNYENLVADVESVLGTLIPKEVEAQTKAGAWYTIRIMPYRTLDNVIEGAVITFVDITSIKKTQEELNGSEARFRSIAESLPQLVWTCLPDGSCDYLGPQWIAFTGIPEVRQLGFLWIEQVHPDDRDSVKAGWQQALKNGSPLRIQFRIKRHDGNYHLFDTNATVLLDAKGKVSKWFGLSMDISESSHVEG